MDHRLLPTDWKEQRVDFSVEPPIFVLPFFLVLLVLLILMRQFVCFTKDPKLFFIQLIFDVWEYLDSKLPHIV